MFVDRERGKKNVSEKVCESKIYENIRYIIKKINENRYMNTVRKKEKWNGNENKGKEKRKQRKTVKNNPPPPPPPHPPLPGQEAACSKGLWELRENSQLMFVISGGKTCLLFFRFFFSLFFYVFGYFIIFVLVFFPLHLPFQKNMKPECCIIIFL